MKTLLFITDMQYDFCNPDGSLYVRGAEQDALRLGSFITSHEELLDLIILTQDNHHVIDISHPLYWEDKNGNPPPPFTIITLSEVLNETWKPRFEKEKTIKYIRDLDTQGEFPHTIWPEHCIIGSAGAAIIGEILEPVKTWARKGRFYEVVIKGTNPYTEHFGAFMANIPVSGSPETQFNKKLAAEVKAFDTILIAGEARSHCVANTVKQMLTIEGIAEKLVILTDCMSDVPGFETLAKPIYEKAAKMGARFELSTVWSGKS